MPENRAHVATTSASEGGRQRAQFKFSHSIFRSVLVRVSAAFHFVKVPAVTFDCWWALAGGGAASIFSSRFLCLPSELSLPNLLRKAHKYPWWIAFNDLYEPELCPKRCAKNKIARCEASLAFSCIVRSDEPRPWLNDSFVATFTSPQTSSAIELNVSCC